MIVKGGFVHVAFALIKRITIESLVSSLLPFTAFTHLGLAMTTLISSSRILKTGIRYFPVDSIQTSRQSLSRSH